jgi:Arc/MetJ family transcription regulator
MKMTMHIDEALLKRVMDTYELETKTDAVEYALKELDRRARLKKFMKEGLGLTAEELKDGVYPGYDPDQPFSGLKVAEE